MAPGLRISAEVLMALLDILGCRMDDLIVPVAAPAAKAKKNSAGQDAGPGPGIGGLRPRRARIVPGSSS